MKRIITGMAVALAALVFTTTVQAQKNDVDLGKFIQSFQSVSGAVKGTVDKTVAAVKAGKYTEALSQLTTLAKQANLTPDQKQAVKDLTAKVKAKLAGTTQKTTQDAQKTADDLKKSLPFGK